MLYSLIKPMLFAKDPETAHELAMQMLKTFHFLYPQRKLKTDPVNVMGIDFPNRIGLAAGFDKNGEYFHLLGRLGFGFIEVGTVTPVAQAGNARPRLFRLKAQRALINRMGFNNDGADVVMENITRLRKRYKGILGINIGKNKSTSMHEAVADYIAGLEKAYPVADYITVNISSPNTPGLRQLQEKEYLVELIEILKEAQFILSSSFGYKPIAIKVAPDLGVDAVMELAEILLKYKVDAVIATNTTIDRRAIRGVALGEQSGGLSGEPLTAQSTRVVATLAATLGRRIPIIGVGGIMSEEDALEKLNIGASLVQVYTGLIYEGPNLVKRLQKATADY